MIGTSGGGLRGRWWATVVAGLFLLSPLLVWSASGPSKLQVEVAGVGGELRQNVLAYLGIYQERERELLPSRVRYLHRLARRQIRRALEPFGYYRSRVEADLERGDGGWVARYRIDPGPPLLVTSLDYQVSGEGAGEAAFTGPFPLQPGDVLDQRRYEAAKRRLLERASELGYLEARMERAEIRIDPRSYTADILLHFDTGGRFLLGPVTFDQDLLDDDVLQRYLEFRPGDPYDVRRLLALQGALLDSEYFRQVEVVPQMDRVRDRQVPLRVVLEPNPRNKYRFGLGYATDYGVRVTLDWDRRLINRRGHRGNLALVLSQRLQQLDGEYRVPLANPRQDFFAVRPSLARYDTDGRQGQTVGLKLLHSVDRDGWRRELGLDLRDDDFRVAETDDRVRELVPFASWSRVRSDDPIYTTHGNRIKLTLLGAAQGLLSDASYLQGRGTGTWIRSFAGDDYRVVARGDLGATLAERVLDLGATRRFFAGGDTSIRGYDLDTLGPRDASGQVVGGRYLAVGSLQLERRLAGKWSLALFVDAGNAYDPDYDNETAVGAGFGLHWRSPLGLIRADLGFALSRDGAPARLHLIIGPDL